MKKLWIAALLVACGGTTQPVRDPRVDEIGLRLTKIEKRHDLLLAAVNYQGSAKTNWWCSSFMCFRGEAMCNAVEQRGAKPGRPAENCLPRRSAFCRGVGFPVLFGQHEVDSLQRAMSCHIGFEDCQKMAADVGGVCVGVE